MNDHGADLLPGMQVIVTDDVTGVVKDLVLVAVTVVDVGAETVSGTAPVGSVVVV